MVDYSSLGKRMRMKRRSLRMSQEQLARSINISTSYYGNIERGIRIPSIDTLVAIANALGTGVDFFLSESLTSPQLQRSQSEIRVLSRYLKDQIAELDYSDALMDSAEDE